MFYHASPIGGIESLKPNISNLSTWQDNSMDRRDTKKISDRKKFNAKLPDLV